MGEHVSQSMKRADGKKWKVAPIISSVKRSCLVARFYFTMVLPVMK